MTDWQNSPAESTMAISLRLIKLLHVLSIFPLSTSTQQPSACSFGCPSNPAILDLSTLLDLKCAMDEDVIAISKSSPIRTAPFCYILCPNTLFEVLAPIIPQLDQTILTCGEDGSSKNECTIVGGKIQVDMNINSTSSSPLPIKLVDFHGLIFRSAENETIINETISIQASASGKLTAYFTDCHWKVSSVWIYTSISMVDLVHLQQPIHTTFVLQM